MPVPVACIVFAVLVGVALFSGGGVKLVRTFRRKQPQHFGPPNGGGSPPTAGFRSSFRPKARHGRRSPNNQSKSVRNRKTNGDLSLCVVCEKPEKKVELYPCGHTDLCEGCALDLNLGKEGCPRCGEEIEGSNYL